MLTQEQLKARRGKLTGSRARIVMTGDNDEQLKLWRQIRGEQPEDDLTAVWAVQLGSTTEGLNLDWYQMQTGNTVSRRGEVVVHRSGLTAVTLDGFIEEKECPIEAKHVGGREPFEVIVARYMAQCHLQMLLTGASRCALSVIVGANAPVVHWITRDQAYAGELMRRIYAFMEHVRDGTPPVPLPPVAPPYEAMTDVDMTSSLEWSEHAGIWLATHKAVKVNKQADKVLKGLVPLDARRAFGAGISIDKDRAGRLQIKPYREIPGTVPGSLGPGLNGSTSPAPVTCCKGPDMKISSAFPTKYLSAADLQGKDVSVTIEGVKMEDLGDDTKPVVSFRNSEKALPLNKTNSATITDLYGDETDDWIGKRITLFPTKVDFQGWRVDAIRIRDVPPAPSSSRRAPPQPAPAPAMAADDDEIPF